MRTTISTTIDRRSLLVAFVLALGAAGTLRAEGREVRLTAPPTVNVGDTLEVLVSIDDASDLAGFRFEIGFDESLLQLASDDVSRGEAFPDDGDGSLTIANFLADGTLRTPGRLVVSGLNTEAMLEGDGAILRLLFGVSPTALDGGESSVSTLVDLIDVRLNERALKICQLAQPGPDETDSECDGNACDDTNVTIGRAEITLEPAELDFGDVPVGAFVDLGFDIRNTGTAVLEVTRVRFADGTSDEFENNERAQVVRLEPGDPPDRTTIRYRPVDEGEDVGAVEVDSNASNGANAQVSLRGVGVDRPEIEIDPPALDFGEVRVGDSVELSYEVRSVGDNLLRVDIPVVDPDPSEFSIVGGGGEVVLEPGAPPHVVTVRYTPIDEGADVASVVVSSNASSDPVVRLSLSGVGLDLPEIEIDPPALDFGEVRVGDAVELSYEVRSIGDNLLRVDIPVVDPDPSEFSIVGGGGEVVLEPGAPPHVVTVRYEPIDDGADVASVVVSSNASNDPEARVSLSGVGLGRAEIEVDPRLLEFGDVRVEEFLELSFEVRSVGNNVLRVDVPVVEPPRAFEFSIVGGGDAVVLEPNGAPHTIVVRYAPLDAGLDLAVIRVTSDADNEPSVAVTLSGTGLPNAPKAMFRRGDADVNGQVELTDAIFVLSFLFLGGPTPRCNESANADNNTTIELTDGIFILNYLFLGGNAPPAPGPNVCGVDPNPPDSPEDLGCADYTGC